jgi:transcription-repair coupling factor (superfamily II helicase)
MRFSGEIGRVRDELDAVGADHDVSIVCQTEAEIERLSELLGDTALARDGRLHFPLGRLHEGFRWLPERAVLVGANEMFHRTERPQQRKHLGKVIDSFLDLRSGDFVVHVAHGVGRYRGMKLLEKQDHAEEHLELEFQGGTKLFVPVSKIALVQKYVGGTKTRPTLAKIGGRSWERKKAAVAECVNDMAVELLEVQAARAVRPGIRFSDDSPWQREFEASFPYEETPDQLSAISSIHDDMVTPRPMDRLICGDVGYGKTELAMRSAFKAVDSGYQVGVLVPTTVLAEQHLRTFSERMGEFPVTIDVLSRFRTRRQQTDVLKKLAEGTIDIVVGTHRLAQRDVRFQNLGLLIIDEEQRFGVEIKERLKALRKTVDVLTLTATPIPRTLHMSLVGLRDISNLETPPEDRLAVETRVTRFSPELVRHAILRELNRGGQAFFVHNRIHGIEAVAQQLREVVPEASIEIGHGQMVEGELERVMCRFVEHRFDVLLATTIVESGLDIPNANTIFIDQADRYGLADLHQLRGRVGRYKHRAYCYLLVDPNKHLNPSATKRLRAIEEYSNIGAGFSLAMRDLEIRGAGNILGTEQSGHIAAVGYQFYCELLDQAVRRLKQMPPADSVDVDVDLPGRAFFPDGYVTDMRSKIDLYRRLTRATTIERLDDLRTELNDRFGPPPVEVEWLLEVALLRIHARHHHIRAIRLEDRYAVLDYASAPAIEQLARTASRPVRIADDQSAYVPLPADISAPDALLAELQSLLRP